MSESAAAPARPRAAWFAAGVAAVLFVALAVLYFVVLLPYRDDHPAGGFTAAEQSAVDAAGTELVDALSYRRAHFEADYQRALAGATGSFRSDLQGRRAAILQTLQKGRFDLLANVTHSALVGLAGDSSAAHPVFVVLVTLDGYQSTQRDVPKQSTLEATVSRGTGGRWLVGDVQSIGIS